jgi:hypothetical protein
MNNHEMTKKPYEVPVIEIVEFTLEDSIAISGDSVSGLICGEEIK